MHARGINACEVWINAHARFCIVCERTCTDLYQNFFGKDLCTHGSTQIKNMQACVSKLRTCLYDSCVYVQQYFAHISSTEARIFMKFETYVHKIVLDHQPIFRAKIRVHEAKTRALAMPYKDSDPSQQKSRKCVFRSFMNRHQKKLFIMSLLKGNIQNAPPL